MSERDDFEAGLNPRARIRNEHGDYVLPSVQDRWSGWFARSESENANFAKLEAQLAEAVWMLNCVMGRDVFGNGTAEVLDRRINAFLARHCDLSSSTRTATAGEVVVTKDEAGRIVAVTRQDEEGRILSVIAESAAHTTALDALQAEVEQLKAKLEGEKEHVKNQSMAWDYCNKERHALKSEVERLKSDAEQVAIPEPIGYGTMNTKGNRLMRYDGLLAISPVKTDFYSIPVVRVDEVLQLNARAAKPEAKS